MLEIKNLSASLESRIGNQSLHVHGLVAQYIEGLNWLAKNDSRTNFVLFLGSTIGNFDPPATQLFMRQMWCSLKNNDYVMIGFDLMKNPKLLYRAYNDPKAAFQKFNLHLLDRINKELGADFDTNAFVQQGHYNPKSGAIESFIYSIQDQRVRMEPLEREFHFKLWEGMQTEHSYKFIFSEIETLAKNTGFEIVGHFFDSRRYFVDSIFKVEKNS